MTYRIDEAFSVSWEITVNGKTQGDGEVLTVTSQIIRDKLQYFLEKMVIEGKIESFLISLERNNLKEAEKTLKRGKK